MKYRIYKYPVKVTATQTIEVPAESELLDMQFQNGELQMWVKIPTQPSLENPWRISLAIVGTGHEVPQDAIRHITTVQSQGYVWHIFATGVE